tara:strand:- start:452 stop:1087 length:636 start_codon:yes stop_codon:yes gene_type:complete
MIIAIDGTAGSGKSTTAKALAKKLNFFHIDSGALYRVATYFCISHDLEPDDNNLESMFKDINIEFNGKKILLNGVDVSLKIREHFISNAVSIYSSNLMIRNKLSNLQRRLAKGKNVVVEGRDIGTAVFPNADFKFYLSADIKVRAARRFKQIDKAGISQEEILKNLIKRDELDMNRKYSPLLKGVDAIEIDTTNLSIDEQVDIIIKTINKE